MFAYIHLVRNSVKLFTTYTYLLCKLYSLWSAGIITEPDNFLYIYTYILYINYLN